MKVNKTLFTEKIVSLELYLCLLNFLRRIPSIFLKLLTYQITRLITLTLTYYNKVTFLTVVIFKGRNFNEFSMTTSKGHQHLCESQLNHHIHQYYNCPCCYHPITRPLYHSFYLFRFVPPSITSTLIVNMTEIIGETKCKRSSR